MKFVAIEKMEVALDLEGVHRDVGTHAWSSQERQAYFEYAPEFIAGSLLISPARLPVRVALKPLGGIAFEFQELHGYLATAFHELQQRTLRVLASQVMAQLELDSGFGSDRPACGFGREGPLQGRLRQRHRLRDYCHEPRRFNNGLERGRSSNLGMGPQRLVHLHARGSRGRNTVERNAVSLDQRSRHRRALAPSQWRRALLGERRIHAADGRGRHAAGLR